MGYTNKFISYSVLGQVFRRYRDLSISMPFGYLSIFSFFEYYPFQYRRSSIFSFSPFLSSPPQYHLRQLSTHSHLKPPFFQQQNLFFFLFSITEYFYGIFYPLHHFIIGYFFQPSHTFHLYSYPYLKCL